MKKLIFTLFLLTGLIAAPSVYAVKSSSGFPVMTAPSSVGLDMTVNDFISFDVKSYRSAEGKKMGWVKRMMIQSAQKNLERKVKKGKMEGTMAMSQVEAGPGNNIFGLLSLVLGVAGWIVPYFGLLMIVAGFVLGLMGLRRDYNPTMAVIGTVIGAIGSAIVLILLLLVLFGALEWD